MNKILENEVEKLSSEHVFQIETEKVKSSETSKHLDDCDTAEVAFTRTAEKEKEDVTENKESKEDVAVAVAQRTINLKNKFLKQVLQRNKLN